MENLISYSGNPNPLTPTATTSHRTVAQAGTTTIESDGCYLFSSAST